MRFARFILALSLLPGVLPAEDPAQLARAGQVAVNQGKYTTAVYFLEQVVTVEPRHATAWRDLCRAYLALDQVDVAIDACNQQIDTYPGSPDVYRALGQALWRKGKRDEAVSALLRQIETDPRNGPAHGDLGRLYCELGRYAEAVTELEKAVAMGLKSTAGQAGLGGAYLELGQAGKGLEVLDKLAQDRPSPDAWNSVAYALASHKVRLERAQQYAESAVAMMAANLRNVDAGHITITALRQVASLAGYWDTLGWVYSQEGSLDKADKFITAAWGANPRGPIADHMGQLYEGRGQKQEAIRAYARALAAPGPLLETRRRLEALLAPGDAAPKVTLVETIPAGPLLPEKATADFYVAQAPDPAPAEARFIRGDDRLKPFAKAVQEATPPGIFPDGTPTKLIRRVTLTCPGKGRDCSIDLLPASDAVFAELNAVPPDTHFASGLGAEKPGVFRIGRDVSPPVPLYKPEPQYSKEALKKKIQGTVVLYVEVDPSGHPRNISVIRSLGHGLDEKAIEAVGKWEFRPGYKDGEPVNVAATIEVNFRLLKDH